MSQGYKRRHQRFTNKKNTKLNINTNHEQQIMVNDKTKTKNMIIRTIEPRTKKRKLKKIWCVCGIDILFDWYIDRKWRCRRNNKWTTTNSSETIPFISIQIRVCKQNQTQKTTGERGHRRAKHRFIIWYIIHYESTERIKKKMLNWKIIRERIWKKKKK